MDAAEILPPLMSLEEFLEWDSHDGLLYQLVDGVPQAMAPAGLDHAAIQAELALIIGQHLRARGSQCRVLTNGGVVPRVGRDQNARIPDLSVRCSRGGPERRFMTDPVLVIEVLSPSNHGETWANVWTYTTIPSVLEILVIRSTAIGADLIRRLPDGGWPDRPEAIEAGGTLTLESIGMSIPLIDAYATAEFVTEN